MILNIKTITFLFALFSCLNLFSQRTCGTMDYINNHPELKAKRVEIEAQIQSIISNDEKIKPTAAIVTIPVVFHIVYGNSTENIPDSRINEQLAVLNQDYRKTNTDVSNVPSVWTSTAADCEIQFCLAKTDPSGNATTGITRTSTTVSSFSTSDAVKFTSMGGKNAWNTTKYLNIWVCDLGGGLLGYATPPGTSASYDGVVLGYKYVGKTGATYPYNKGRTATHEVGHWLNLDHIWGDDGSGCTGSDYVSDTPNQQSASGGCPSFPDVDGCTTTSPGIMFMNYMDYSNDACMYMFTNGQKTRMKAVLNSVSGARKSLLTSTACSVATGLNDMTELKTAISIYPNPSSNGLYVSSFDGISSDELTVNVVNSLGKQLYQYTSVNLNTSPLYIEKSIVNTPGIYFIEVLNKETKAVFKVIITE